jgi:hypothetical protein
MEWINWKRTPIFSLALSTSAKKHTRSLGESETVNAADRAVRERYKTNKKEQKKCQGSMPGVNGRCNARDDGHVLTLSLKFALHYLCKKRVLPNARCLYKFSDPRFFIKRTLKELVEQRKALESSIARTFHDY